MQASVLLLLPCSRISLAGASSAGDGCRELPLLSASPRAKLLAGFLRALALARTSARVQAPCARASAHPVSLVDVACSSSHGAHLFPLPLLGAAAFSSPEWPSAGPWPLCQVSPLLLALCTACSCAQRAQPAPCRVPAELLLTAPCRGFLFMRLPWPRPEICRSLLPSARAVFFSWHDYPALLDGRAVAQLAELPCRGRHVPAHSSAPAARVELF
jgi:hypothetical protein